LLQVSIPISLHVIGKLGEQVSWKNQDLDYFKVPHPLFVSLSDDFVVRGHQELSQINGPIILHLGFLPPYNPSESLEVAL